jgi:hypothetical protein
LFCLMHKVDRAQNEQRHEKTRVSIIVFI